MKVVVVGCGGMARRWVRLAVEHERIELAGLVDRNRAAAEAMAQQFELGGAVVFDDLSTAVRSTRAEAVFDVTVPAAHASVTLEALGLGCHVLGEKPMSDSLDRARAMVDAAAQADRIYAVTQTRRPLPGAFRTQRLIETGTIGGVEEAHVDFFIGARFDGFRVEMDHPLILDMAIHTFDNARQLTGARPRSVVCHSWNPPRSWYAGHASALGFFEMERDDGQPVRLTYRGSWTMEGHETAWAGQWRIGGEKGTVVWDGEDAVVAEVIDPACNEGFTRPVTTVEAPPLAMERTGHAYLIDDFVKAVESGGEHRPLCPAADNFASLAMVLAAVDSAERGERVEVPS